MGDTQLRFFPIPGGYHVHIAKRNAVGKTTLSLRTDVLSALRPEDVATLSGFDVLEADIRLDREHAGRQLQYILDDTMTAAEELEAAYREIGRSAPAFWRVSDPTQADATNSLSDHVQQALISAFFVRLRKFLTRYSEVNQEEPKELAALLEKAYTKIANLPQK